MRTAVSILLALALPASLLAAPFSHVHDAGVAESHVEEHHAGGVALHLHVASAQESARTWAREADESAHSLNFFRAETVDGFELWVALVGESVDVPVELYLAGRSQDCDVSIHDPPRISLRSPRAPPL